MFLNYLVRSLGGAFKHPPEEMHGNLSAGARQLVHEVMSDVEPGSLRDYHVHMVGPGTSDSGATINKKLLSWHRPIIRLKALVYLSGAGITDEDKADEQYVERLVRLVRSVEGFGKLGILAFDRFYNPDGSMNEDKSEFYTPTDYVVRLAGQYPDVFFPIASVHPYRADAVDELHRAADQGVKIMKWLPNSQGMNASDERIIPYYNALRERDMVLLSHVGEGKAVEAVKDQALGNPLLFRLPLDRGVTVIMAHAGSLGDNEDFDNPGQRADNFDLLIRLFEEPKYEEILFADISSITQFNRLPGPLLSLLRRTDLHHRLINGSDYPLPALNIMVQIQTLIKHGLIAEKDRDALKEIYSYNPLVFDYAVKRRLRHPETGTQFPAKMFVLHPSLPLV